MNSDRKFFRIVFGGIGILLLFMVVLVVLVNRDTRENQYPELAIDRPDISDADNAFTYFSQATNHIVLTDSDQDHMQALVKDGKIPGEFDARTVLAQNGEVFELIRQGLEKGIAVSPRIDGFNDLLPWLIKWRTISRLYMVKIYHGMQNGESQTVVEDTIELLQFGYLIKEHTYTIIEHLVGAAVFSVGMDHVRMLAAGPHLSEMQLNQLLEYFKSLKDMRIGMERAFKGEFRLASNTIKGIHDGTLDIGALTGANNIGFLRGFLKKNKTIDSFAKSAKLHIQNLNTTWSNYQTDPEIKKLIANSKKLSNIFKGNFAGNLIIGMMLPSFESTIRNKFEMLAEFEATKIILALRLYEERHGGFPDSLGQLVEEGLLKAIPLDPFDGKPMRYSNATPSPVVFSVSADLDPESEQAEKVKFPVREDK